MNLAIALPSDEEDSWAPFRVSQIEDKKSGHVTNVYIQGGGNAMSQQGKKALSYVHISLTTKVLHDISICSRWQWWGCVLHTLGKDNVP